MISIPVGKNIFAFVDDVDFDLCYYEWSLTEWGYVRGRMDGRIVYLHKVIGSRIGLSQSVKTDHKDMNPLNNMRNNLREATQSQNAMNRLVQINNRLGFKGIYMQKGRFRVQIRLNGKKIHIGIFESVDEAIDAYEKASIHYFGEFKP